MTTTAIEAERNRKIGVYEQESNKLTVFLDKQRQEAIARHEEYNTKRRKEVEAAATARDMLDNAREAERKASVTRHYSICNDLPQLSTLHHLFETLIDDIAKLKNDIYNVERKIDVKIDKVVEDSKIQYHQIRHQVKL